MEIELFDKDKLTSKIFERVGRRKAILLLVCIVWGPVALFTVFMGKSMLSNVPLNIRFLISLPLLLISHPLVLIKMNWVLVHFQEANIIESHDREKLGQIIDSTENLTHSHTGKRIILALIYGLTLFDYFFENKMNTITTFSLGPFVDWWVHFISQPIYWFVMFNFLLHLILWWRLMFKISLLNLKVRPTDGDNTGGLGFLSKILNSFLVPAFAFSTAAAAGAAGLILSEKLSLPGLKIVVAGISGIILVLFVGPLLLFVPVLMKTKSDYIHQYGVLSSHQLNDFENKWVKNYSTVQEALTVSDFSSVADYGSVVTRVHEMKVYPIKTFDLASFVVAIGLPFLPVFSLEMPWKEIFQQMFSIVR